MLAQGLNLNSAIMHSLTSGFCKVNQLDDAEWLMEHMLLHGPSAYPGTQQLLVVLFTSYARSLGKLEDTVSILEEMLARNFLIDKVTYNTLIFGYCKEGKLEEAFNLREEMAKRGTGPDIFTYTSFSMGFLTEERWRKP
ncbi:hypothetical protein Leryth_018782 [Lithospermum erythrorhizon]|nr:hypothetical protein Leryth_018782 [Lithospermum erythrorhizon]